MLFSRATRHRANTSYLAQRKLSWRNRFVTYSLCRFGDTSWDIVIEVCDCVVWCEHVNIWVHPSGFQLELIRSWTHGLN